GASCEEPPLDYHESYKEFPWSCYDLKELYDLFLDEFEKSLWHETERSLLFRNFCSLIKNQL
ncbi:hypothetical protein, partial [Acidithiobacillus sp.]|uniref:hypothetical protein n=1 Tax=Acidithiobacillus sp. TaxID=1872118 RepID=UPI003D0099AE